MCCVLFVDFMLVIYVIVVWLDFVGCLFGCG